MTRDRLITTALAAILALPVSAAAPGYFQVPGTETTLQIYGNAELDTTYDSKGNGTVGTLNGLKSAAVATPDDKGPSGKNDWTVNASRFGITSTTPSEFGDVIFKFEGDFNNASGNNGLRIRHFYGQAGHFLAGQTWNLFLDKTGDGVIDMPLDVEGLVGCYQATSTRIPQIRYWMDLSKQASLAFSAEQSKTNSSIFPAASMTAANTPFPSLLSAFTFKDGWGHVRAAVALQKYDGWTAATPTTGEKDVTKTSFSWNIASTIKFGMDNLAASYGKGDGEYGPGLNSQDGVVFTTNKNSLNLVQGSSWSLGYTHFWTPATNSSLFVSGVKYSQDDTNGINTTKFEKYLQYGLNTVVTMSKTFKVGAEYIYGEAETFADNAITNLDGSKTNKITESKFRIQLKYYIF